MITTPKLIRQLDDIRLLLDEVQRQVQAGYMADALLTTQMGVRDETDILVQMLRQARRETQEMIEGRRPHG